MHGTFRCLNRLQNGEEGGGRRKEGEKKHPELVEDGKGCKYNKYPGTLQMIYSAKSTLTATRYYF